jgi:hypothetical protein
VCVSVIVSKYQWMVKVNVLRWVPLKSKKRTGNKVGTQNYSVLPKSVIQLIAVCNFFPISWEFSYEPIILDSKMMFWKGVGFLSLEIFRKLD